jgi:hypothetical protein
MFTSVAQVFGVTVTGKASIVNYSSLPALAEMLKGV